MMKRKLKLWKWKRRKRKRKKKSDEVDKNAEEAAEKSEAEKAFEKHINEATPVAEPECQLAEAQSDVYHPDAAKLAEAQSLVEDLGLGSPAPLKLKDYNAEFEAKVKEAGDNESFKAYKYAVEIRYRGHINFWQNSINREKEEDKNESKVFKAGRCVRKAFIFAIVAGLFSFIAYGQY